MDFERLISPKCADEFFSEYWEDKILHIPGAQRNRFDEILKVEDLDQFFSRSDLRVPALRLMREGRSVPTSEYTSNLVLGNFRTDGLIKTDRVLHHYSQGATIIIQLAHLSIPRLTLSCSRLEQYLGFNVEMNVYLTPEGFQGFAPHYDNHSVFVAQIAGEKTWSIYQKTQQLPLLSDRFDIENDDPGQLTQEIVLKPGSLLYIPRGIYHGARASVTIGLFPATWFDLFSDHLAALAARDHFRQAPSPKSTFDASAMRDFASTFDVDAVIGGVRERTIDNECQPSEGRLFDTIASVSLKTNSYLKLRKGLKLSVTTRDDAVVLHSYGKKIILPIPTRDSLLAILDSQGAFTSKQMECSLDQEGALVLCRRLLREGILTTLVENQPEWRISEA